MVYPEDAVWVTKGARVREAERKGRRKRHTLTHTHARDEFEIRKGVGH